MTAHIKKAPREDIGDLISSRIAPNIDPVELRILERYVQVSQSVWYCDINGKFIGIWGVIPPTLMSDQAYLWFHNNEAISSHEFIYVRHSQVAIAEILQQWSMILGHVEASSTKSIRWLKWLGAELQEPIGKLIPFVIRRKNG